MAHHGIVVIICPIAPASMAMHRPARVDFISRRNSILNAAIIGPAYRRRLRSGSIIAIKADRRPAERHLINRPHGSAGGGDELKSSSRRAARPWPVGARKRGLWRRARKLAALCLQRGGAYVAPGSTRRLKCPDSSASALGPAIKTWHRPHLAWPF